MENVWYFRLNNGRDQRTNHRYTKQNSWVSDSIQLTRSWIDQLSTLVVTHWQEWKTKEQDDKINKDPKDRTKWIASKSHVSTNWTTDSWNNRTKDRVTNTGKWSH